MKITRDALGDTVFDLGQVKEWLNDRALRYEHQDFITTDPIQIPHKFGRKEDIEISAFLTATIAWGNRKSIITNAQKLIEMMDNAPYDFIMGADFNREDYNSVRRFVHRTFNGEDCLYFLRALQRIYLEKGGLESIFDTAFQQSKSVKTCLESFRKEFFQIPHPTRVLKHVSDVTANSAAKRLNMFLRWMVRSSDKGVDFGLWSSIPTSSLMLPLDVHTGNVARALGLLHRKQNDWKALEELMQVLRSFDNYDPVKYDYALFGIGVFEWKENEVFKI